MATLSRHPFSPVKLSESRSHGPTDLSNSLRNQQQSNQNQLPRTASSRHSYHLHRPHHSTIPSRRASINQNTPRRSRPSTSNTIFQHPPDSWLHKRAEVVRVDPPSCADLQAALNHVANNVDSGTLPPRRRNVRTPSTPSDSRWEEKRPFESRRVANRRIYFRRSRRREVSSASGTTTTSGCSDSKQRLTIANEQEPFETDRHIFYDPDVDCHWRLDPARRIHCDDLFAYCRSKDGSTSEQLTRWSTGLVGDSGYLGSRTAGSSRTGLRAQSRHVSLDRNENRELSRDRSGKRIGNSGARWRGLMARKDLVDGKADITSTDTNVDWNDLSPRSSLEIEEATSLSSWDDPPSTFVREWRSNHSLSFRPRPNARPRHIRVIGRQRCINDMTDIVDASNEACVSYDRQLFDPVSKLWTYVEASQPSSSPWELRTVGSPVTCSVSGTDDALSTGARVPHPSSSAPASSQASTAQTPPPPDVPVITQSNGQRERASRPRQTSSEFTLRTMQNSQHTNVRQALAKASLRRNSSPGVAEDTDAGQVRSAFDATRDQWLGYSRKSVYGPANLEAVIFASELDDAQEVILRRASIY